MSESSLEFAEPSVPPNPRTGNFFSSQASEMSVHRGRQLWALSLAAALLQTVVAHPHHDVLSEVQLNAPTDAILWIHIILQATVWGILFPIGMVLGITRSRWHVPLQVRCIRSGLRRNSN